MTNYTSIILSCAFAEENRKDALPYMERLIEEKPYSPSDLEKYSFSIMGEIHRTATSFTALDHTRVYIRCFRTNKLFREAGIVKGNYINYHYIKYAVTILTILDICLILTNDTFRLGIPERLCSLGRVTKNSSVVASNISETLNKISALVEPWREPRNFFVHRGWQIYRDRLTALEEYELMREKGMLERKIPEWKIKSAYQSELSVIFKEFDEIEIPLFGSVNELLSGLFPVYLSQRAKLQKSPIGN